MLHRTDDLRIKEIKELAPPTHLLREFPLSEKAADTTFEARQDIHRIIHGADDRMLVIMGPCSVHDVKAAKEYAGKLLEAKKKHAADLLVVDGDPTTSLAMLTAPDTGIRLLMQGGRTVRSISVFSFIAALISWRMSLLADTVPPVPLCWAKMKSMVPASFVNARQPGKCVLYEVPSPSLICRSYWKRAFTAPGRNWLPGTGRTSLITIWTPRLRAIRSSWLCCICPFPLPAFAVP